MNGPIVVIDYGAGNLRSVARALAHVGAEPVVSADPDDIDGAAGVILPGVGAAADTMSNLESRNLVGPLRGYIDEGRPFLGVCMGLQALFDSSEEGGGQACMGVLPGTIRRFPTGEGRKVPHMGWNTVEWTREHPVVEGIESGRAFYFVHGFYPDVGDESLTLGRTDYGVSFASVVARGNVVATQFHPEKSSDSGLRLYENFVRWARAGGGVAAGVASGRSAT